MSRYTNRKHSRLKCKFPGSENIVKNYSQAYQDLFALAITNGKQNGTFLEIGAYHSTKNSNTYIAEQQYGWNGLSLDISKRCIEDFAENRSCTFLLADATKVDYDQELQKAGLPTHIDYLQLDIDPCQITYKAMLQIPFEKYTFSCITFETEYIKRDKQLEAVRVREESRKFFAEKGYIRVAGDIAGKKDKPFEDWYVSKEVAESEHFKTYFEIAPDFDDLGENYLLNPEPERKNN